MSRETSTVSGRVVEPLGEAAPIQWETAQRCCVEECRWYHGPRLYLRAANFIRGARADSQFLVDTFARLAASGRLGRVLISGAADFGTLAHLIAGFQAVNQPLHVTVVDKCATPLRLNEWLAQRVGVSLTSIHGDIVTFETAERFDLVCTHAFLGRFDRAGRTAVIQRWHDLLVPGGAVVTAHRLREALPSVEIPIAATDGAWIRDRAYRALARPMAIAGIDPAQLTRWIDECLERKMTHPISSIPEERRLFEHAGFDPVVFTPLRGEEVDETLADRAPRIGIVAHRPR